jgi:hypothetical protein
VEEREIIKIEGVNDQKEKRTRLKTRNINDEAT